MRINSLLATVAFFCALFATSCKTMNLPNTIVKTEPYVRLKSGEKYMGKNIERSEGFLVKDRITLDDTTFKTKDVAFYSTGQNTYANIGRRFFASQVGAGKIGLFKYIVVTTTVQNGFATTSARAQYLIQKQPDAPVKKLTYANLKPLVQPNTPEYAMLQKAKGARLAAQISGVICFGLLAGGTGMLAAESYGIGAAMLAGGCLAYIPFGVFHMTNKNRQLKTVIIADQIEKDKNAKHRRVE